jgi:hypothetical protein
MMFPVVRMIAFVLLVTPVVVQAGPLKLVFGAGVVSIDADEVPLGTILDEWAKLGGTRVDGIDKLSEVAVTFHVEGIPEDEALAALLNGRNGYSTVLRKAGEAGASLFARIAVLSPTRQPIVRPSVVPKDWPFQLNENPDGVEPQPPRPDVVIERPGIDIPWPFELNYTAPEVPPASVESGLPGIDVPWPFPLNWQPTLDLGLPTTEVIDPKLDVWPFPLNRNADPDAQTSSDPPTTVDAAQPAADKGAGDKAAADQAKTKGAPVSTKAPKPIPPKRPPVQQKP